MKEAFEKTKVRIEAEIIETLSDGGDDWFTAEMLNKAIEIVNQVAEEYGTDINVGSKDGWIPCSGCKDCQHKECEHYGKI